MNGNVVVRRTSKVAIKVKVANMSPQDVREYMNTRPFQPFRITLTDGRTFDVRHPEMAMVGYTSVLVGLMPSDSDDPYFERAAHVAMNHIMQIEHVDTARTG